MKVEVYRNLHKNCWSIRDNKTGRVIDHVDSIHIKDANLVVRKAGREKVLREKRKNVHAFVKGTIENCSSWHNEEYGGKLIAYNPYKYDSFVLVESAEPIFNAEHVYLNENGEVWK